MTDKQLDLLVDTNLFFECLKLEQLPWLELGAGTIVLWVTKPVLDEIDNHKKQGTGRTRGRALEVWQRIRRMLDKDQKESVVQASDPRVIFRVPGPMPHDNDIQEHLNTSKPDDCLISILSKANKHDAPPNLCLFTHDTGPAANARGFGLPVRLIKDSWLRPQRPSEDSKRIEELEQTLALYESNEPSFSVTCSHLGKDVEAIKVVKKVREPLSADKVDTLIGELKRRMPIKNDYSKPASGLQIADDTRGIEHIAPDEGAIKEYQEKLYPEWLEACRNRFENLHTTEEPFSTTVPLVFFAENIGTRPAQDARIEFVAQGPISISRDPDQSEDEEHEAEHIPSNMNAHIKLPPAPMPPEWSVKRTQAKVTPRRLNTPLASATASLQGLQLPEQLTSLQKISMGLYTPHIEGLNQSQKLAARILGPMPRNSLGEISTATATYEHLPIFDIPKSHKHDIEAFYYDKWPLETPVDECALKIDLWRHANGSEKFDLNIHFDSAVASNALIKCRIHASNLTKPHILQIPVQLEVKSINILELAQTMVEKFAPQS